MPDIPSPVVLIVGPTAVGKTRMAVELAGSFPDLEVISADSRQIFRYMDIGTAKPSLQERASVPHHFIDIRDPDESFNAGEFGTAGRKLHAKLLAQGKLPIVVGGSGLYIRSLIDGLFVGRVSDPEVKARLQEQADRDGLEPLYRQLQNVDPESAARIHRNDRQRIVRALEVWHITGEPISRLRKKLQPVILLRPVLIGLNRQRKALYQSINARVDRMRQMGLIEEVRNLREKGYHRNLQSQRTVGYQEIHDYFDEKISLETAFELIKRNSRRFAKRQLTWFNRDRRIQWFFLDDEEHWRKTRKFIAEQIRRSFL